MASSGGAKPDPGAGVGDKVKSWFDNVVGRGLQTLQQSMARDRRRATKEELGIQYVTSRLIVLRRGLVQPKSGGMLLPFESKSTRVTDSSAYMSRVAAYMNREHPGRFMVWNLSDATYDTRPFADQVITFSFNGLPTPQLEVLHQICRSIDSWLAADSGNVALVHCQSGRGRTHTALAAYLHHTKVSKTTSEAVSFLEVATIGNMSPSASPKRTGAAGPLLVPSQRRYLGYFENYLTRGAPPPRRVRLRRVVCNTVPAFGAIQGVPGSCRPYLQVFQDGKLIATSTRGDARETGTTSESLRVYSTPDRTFTFYTDQTLQGDTVVRLRHFASKKKRVTMLRVGFHTGYLEEVKEGKGFVLRFAKSQLDVAHNSSKFDDDFTLDLFFDHVKGDKAEGASNETMSATGVEKKASESSNSAQPRETKTKVGAKSVAARAVTGLSAEADSDDEAEALIATLASHISDSASNSETPAISLPEPTQDAADAEDDDAELLAALEKELADG